MRAVRFFTYETLQRLSQVVGDITRLVTKNKDSIVDAINELASTTNNTIPYPIGEDGEFNYGEPNQFLVSNGDKTTSWVTVQDAEGGEF